MCNGAVGFAGCRLCKALYPVVTGCRNRQIRAEDSHRAVFVCKAFAAGLAGPVFDDARLGAGRVCARMMRQLVAECRDSQVFIRKRLGALCIRIAFAADFAFPVCSCAGFLAGCWLCSMLYERMLLSRHLEGFLADVSAVAGEVIGAAVVAGAGFVCLCRCRLVHILVDRRDADCRFFFLIIAVIILLNQRCEIAFCNCFILSVQSCCFDLDVMYLVREVQLAGVF